MKKISTAAYVWRSNAIPILVAVVIAFFLHVSGADEENALTCFVFFYPPFGIAIGIILAIRAKLRRTKTLEEGCCVRRGYNLRGNVTGRCI